MQRILYCTDSLMAGGTEQQLIELITRLDRQRYEVFVICLYGKRVERSLHFLDVLHSHDISVLLFDLDWSVGSKVVGLARLLYEIWRIRPHIVQAVNYHSNLLLRIVRPFLPALHLIGCIFVEYTQKQLRYERASHWLCTRIVCNSVELQQQLKAFVPHRSVVVIPNGIDFQRFMPRPEEPFSEPKAFVILVIGRIAEQKAPYLAVEALGILKQQGMLPSAVVLWLVGECEENRTQKRISEAVQKYGLQDVVFQYPATHIPEVYYRTVQLVLLTSLWEGLPSVVLEALATGHPVILSEAANRAEIITNGLNGWVFRTGDVEHLDEVLSKVLALPSSVLHDMNKVCRESVAVYSVQTMVENYVRLYESLMTRS